MPAKLEFRLDRRPLVLFGTVDAAFIALIIALSWDIPAAVQVVTPLVLLVMGHFGLMLLRYGRTRLVLEQHQMTLVSAFRTQSIAMADVARVEAVRHPWHAWLRVVSRTGRPRSDIIIPIDQMGLDDRQRLTQIFSHHRWLADGGGQGQAPPPAAPGAPEPPPATPPAPSSPPARRP